MKPAPKSQKASIKKPKSYKKPLLILLTLLTVAVMAGGVSAYTNYRNGQTQKEQAFAADKARFAKVEADMAEAYAVMIAAAGKPETESRNKGCSHISAKFDKGTLRCAILYKFTFPHRDTNGVKDNLILSEHSLIGMGRFIKAADSNNVSDIQEAVLNKRALELSYLYNGHMSCKLTTHPENYDFAPNEVVKWDYVFSCRDEAIAPVYPLAE